jgi:hypothetical protein
MESAYIESNEGYTATYPFKALELNGQYTFTSGGAIKLLDTDTWSVFDPVSGALYFKVNDGWKMEIRILTANSGYFKQIGLQETSRIRVESKVMDGWGKTDNLAYIKMAANDSISCDVDDVSGNSVAAFKIILNGDQKVNQSDVFEMDDQVYFSIVKIEKLETVEETYDCPTGTTYDPLTETCVPDDPEKDGNGNGNGNGNGESTGIDTDGDGITDEYDPYPYDSTLPDNSGNGGNGGNGNNGSTTTIEVVDYGLIGIVFAAAALGYIIYFAVRSD